MQGETGKLWRSFCAQAAVEQDAEKLLELTQEINRLLAEKEARLQSARRSTGYVGDTADVPKYSDLDSRHSKRLS